MIILIFLLISYTLCCEPCFYGPIKLSSDFSIMGSRLENLFIQSDRMFFNNYNASFKFFDSNSTKCGFFKQQLVSNYSLKSTSRYVQLIDTTWSSYQATWAYTFVFYGVGDVSCNAENYYQITLISDSHASFILVQYYHTSWNHRFYIGLDLPNIKKHYISNHSQLVSDSNIGIRGKWIFLVDEKNISKLNYFDIRLILFLLIINKYLI